MMKHLKRTIIALLIIIAAFLIFAAFLPAKKHIEDSITITAPAELIFKKVNSLKNWEVWSPFQTEDTAMTSVYDGPESGVGAVQTWESKVNGDGSMTIIESIPHEFIKMKLDFIEGELAYSDWKFEKDSQDVKVTWSVDISELAYPLGRIFGLLMPGMMHNSFQKGLAKLKEVCEQEYEDMTTYKTGEVKIEEVQAWSAIVVKDSASCDSIEWVIGRAFFDLNSFLQDNELECIGPPFAIYYLWDETINKFVMEAGMPVKSKVDGKGRIYYKDFSATRVATAIHYGAYETTYYTYQAIEDYVFKNQLTQSGFPWEVYINDPETVKDVKKLETQIFYPVE